jgi:transposase InsO family protein
MGRVGTTCINAEVASFSALLENNVLDRRAWVTLEGLRIAIVTLIERTYHPRRRQDALSRLTPIAYEIISTEPATQAAPPHVSRIRAQSRPSELNELPNAA